LIPVVEQLLKDTNDVRDGVLHNYPQFIRVLNEEDREHCI